MHKRVDAAAVVAAHLSVRRADCRHDAGARCWRPARATRSWYRT